MKIYFENGYLLPKSELPFERNYSINAGCGYSYCENTLRYLNKYYPESVVYTNMVTALSNFYAWNDELGAPEIYMRNESGEFVRIDELAKGKIRRAQNVMAMYLSGVFGNVPVTKIGCDYK